MRSRLLRLLLLSAGTALIAPLGSAAAATPDPVSGGGAAPVQRWFVAAKYRVAGDLEEVPGIQAWAGSSITWFDKSPALAKLINPAFYVLRPDRNGKATLTLDALAADPVLAVQVAIDRKDGFQLIAVGTTAQPSGESTSPESANASAADANAVTAAASGHKWGRFYTEWSDPFWIPVSTVKTWIDWYYSGGTVDSFTAGDFRTAFGENGWHEIYHYFSKHWDRTETKGVADTGSRTQTTSWFPSPTCGTSTIYYSYNEAVAYGDGHIGGTVTTWVNSGCAYFLTWNAGPGYS